MSKNEKSEKVKHIKHYSGGGSGAVYGLGLLGALYYFITTAPTFWDGAIGVLKAFVWPAILVYSLLDFLKI
jgi:hypothetical protein